MIRRRKPLRRNSKPIARRSPLRKKRPRPVRSQERLELDRLVAIAAWAIRGDRCQYPDCRWKCCDPHHIVPRGRDGTRWDVENILNLCRVHHTGPTGVHSVPKGQRNAFYLEKFGVDRLALLERAARNPRPDKDEVKRGLLELIRSSRLSKEEITKIEEYFS